MVPKISNGRINVYKPPIVHHSPSAPMKATTFNIQNKQPYKPQKTLKGSYLDRRQNIPFKEGVTFGVEGKTPDQKRKMNNVTTRVIRSDREKVVDPPYFTVQSSNHGLNRYSKEKQVLQELSNPNRNSRSSRKERISRKTGSSKKQPVKIKESTTLLENSEQPFFVSMARLNPQINEEEQPPNVRRTPLKLEERPYQTNPPPLIQPRRPEGKLNLVAKQNTEIYSPKVRNTRTSIQISPQIKQSQFESPPKELYYSPVQQIQDSPQKVVNIIQKPKEFHISPPNSIQVSPPRMVNMSQAPEHLQMMSYQIPTFPSPRHSPIHSPFASPYSRSNQQKEPIFITAPVDQPIYQIPTEVGVQQFEQNPQMVQVSPMKMMAANITPTIKHVHIKATPPHQVVEVVKPVHIEAPPPPVVEVVTPAQTVQVEEPQLVTQSQYPTVHFSPAPHHKILYSVPTTQHQVIKQENSPQKVTVKIQTSIETNNKNSTTKIETHHVITTPKRETIATPRRRGISAHSFSQSPIQRQPSQQPIIFAVPVDQIERMQNGPYNMVNVEVTPSKMVPLPRHTPLDQMPQPMPMIQHPPMVSPPQNVFGTPRVERPENTPPRLVVSPPQNRIPVQQNLLVSIPSDEEAVQIRTGRPSILSPHEKSLTNLQNVPALNTQPQHSRGSFVVPGQPVIGQPHHMNFVPVATSPNIPLPMVHPHQHPQFPNQMPPPGHVIVAHPNPARHPRHLFHTVHDPTVAPIFTPGRTKRISWGDKYDDDIPHHQKQYNEKLPKEQNFVLLPTIDIPPRSANKFIQKGVTSRETEQIEKPKKVYRTLSRNPTPPRKNPIYKREEMGPNPYYDDQRVLKMNQNKNEYSQISSTPTSQTDKQSIPTPLSQSLKNKNQENQAINVLTPPANKNNKVSINSYLVPNVQMEDLRQDSMEDLPPEGNITAEATAQTPSQRENKASSNCPQSMLMDDKGNMYMLVKAAQPMKQKQHLPQQLSRVPTMVSSQKVTQYQLMNGNSHLSGVIEK